MSDATKPRRRLIFVAISLLVIAALVVGGLQVAKHRQAQVLSRENLTAAISDFLDQRGYVCLAKYDWPITVAAADVQAHRPEANQMPVLETLGLVAGRDVAQAREYQLTDTGRKYWRQVPVVVNTALQHTTHPGDLCAARLSLDRVIGWERPMTLDDHQVTSVLFTYRITPEPWALKPEVRQVFPAVSRAIDGAGTVQLREGVHLTWRGWVVDELVSP